MQTNLKHFLVTLHNLFHMVTGNIKHTIIILGLINMYLLPHVCIKHIFDLPAVWKKIPKPPLSLIKLLMSDKENNSLGKHVAPLAHINKYSDA
jgi:hypothetical protein